MAQCLWRVCRLQRKPKAQVSILHSLWQIKCFQTLADHRNISWRNANTPHIMRMNSAFNNSLPFDEPHARVANLQSTYLQTESCVISSIFAWGAVFTHILSSDVPGRDVGSCPPPGSRVTGRSATTIIRRDPRRATCPAELFSTVPAMMSAS